MIFDDVFKSFTLDMSVEETFYDQFSQILSLKPYSKVSVFNRAFRRCSENDKRMFILVKVLLLDEISME